MPLGQVELITWCAIAMASFTAYSLVGWVFECAYCSITERRFINRGFLNGPYCPIYGAGGITAALLLSEIPDPVAVFVLGGVLCCTIEYATSWVMERMFHARWWDYSDRLFNLHGRVCLAGALLFGAASVIVVFAAQPMLNYWLSLLPQWMLLALAAICALAMLLDVLVTNMGLSGFRDKVDMLCDQMTERAQLWYAEHAAPGTMLEENIERAKSSPAGRAYERLQDAEALRSAHEKLADAFVRSLNRQEMRVLGAFPKIRATRSNEALSRIRKHLRS